MSILTRLMAPAILALFSSCAKICSVPATGVKVNDNHVAFATSKIPCNKTKDYEDAVKGAIVVIYSGEFETRLGDHIKNHIGTGPHAKAWENLDAGNIAANMRRQLHGQYVETYGGIKGWWLYTFYHNIAYDGTMHGPIKLNRIPLRKRDAASIANTIAHETAHRIGLGHPHSSSSLPIAYKEPPYIIGKLVEDLFKKTK